MDEQRDCRQVVEREEGQTQIFIGINGQCRGHVTGFVDNCTAVYFGGIGRLYCSSSAVGSC